MERLWAPWRIEYILSEKGDECIFCTHPKGDPEEKLVLYRGKLCFVMMNRYPYNSGHLMVAPYRHVGNITELTEEEADELMKLTRECVRVLQEVLKPDGFNIGMNIGRVAGAGFEHHVHMHVVPRWNGDVNFMPVIANCRVVVEYLHETYRKLKPHFEKIENIEKTGRGS